MSAAIVFFLASTTFSLFLFWAVSVLLYCCSIFSKHSLGAQFTQRQSDLFKNNYDIIKSKNTYQHRTKCHPPLHSGTDVLDQMFCRFILNINMSPLWIFMIYLHAPTQLRPAEAANRSEKGPFNFPFFPTRIINIYALWWRGQFTFFSSSFF